MLNRDGKIVVKVFERFEIIEGIISLSIEKFKLVIVREYKYNYDKIEVIEIGYDEKGIIKRFDKKVKKVFVILLEEVISLYRVFDGNENEIIENLGK